MLRSCAFLCFGYDTHGQERSAPNVRDQHFGGDLRTAENTDQRLQMLTGDSAKETTVRSGRMPVGPMD
jgi:hypothetical protein